MLPYVAVIVINWNGRDDTLACLASLSQLDYPSYEVIVVDNGSSDDSVAVIRAAYPHITLLETGHNLGYVGGNNLGLERAQAMGAGYSLLLNNDTEVAPDSLRLLVQACQAEDRVGMAGPTIYYFDQPDIIWSAGGVIDWGQGNPQMIGLNQKDRGQFGQLPRPVDFVTGCALLVKLPVVEQIGLLDERFFAYYEEVEWCVRATTEGYTILHVPRAKIWHKISPEKRAASPQTHYYMTRNRLLFLKCTNAGWKAWFYTLVVNDLRTILSWSLRPKWRHKRAQLKAMIQAICDAWQGHWGARILN